MKNALGNNTKAKLLFVIIAFVLVLTTWYKLKIQGITMTATSEVEYQEVLICENKNPDHIHTDDCYDLVAVETMDDNLGSNNHDSADDTQDEVLESENTLDSTNNILGTNNNHTIEEVSANAEESNIASAKELKFEDDDIIVIITEKEDNAIPDGATVVVTPILKEDDVEKYSQIEEKLTSKMEENNEFLAGFLAYDIMLKDEAGNEIEPNSKVNVSIEYKNAVSIIDEKDETLKLNVHHFEENETGDISVVNLSEKDDLKNVKTNKNSEIEKIDFETESFSPFTISYSGSSVVVTVHFVDELGNELNSNQNNLSGNFNSATINLESTFSNKMTQSGYVYVGAHYSSKNGQTITDIKSQNGKDDSISINPSSAVINKKTKTITVNGTVEFLNNNDVVGIIEYEDLNRTIDVYLVYATTSGLSIEDTIANNGCINALTNGQVAENTSDIIYKWYRSTDNNTYNEVQRLKITGDSYNIPVKDGPYMNVALDEGADLYYKVVKYQVLENDEIQELDSATYHVPYYAEVQNGNFETPVVSQGAYNQIPNGSNGVVWKTTGPNGGRDIEIVNANSSGTTIKAANNADSTFGFYHFAYVPEGNQCAELNCEAAGALYQDLLTVPGSQLYWSLYHRARGNSGNRNQENGHTDTMYVVVMSTEAAEKYDVTTQAKVLNIKKMVEEGKPGFEDVEVITLTTTNNGKGTMKFADRPGAPGAEITVDSTPFGKVTKKADGTTTVTGQTIQGRYYAPSNWHYYTGHFSIPENQYLTRFFFVAGDTASGSDTVGNLLDDIKVSDQLPPPNDNQATLRIKKTVYGVEELESTYSVPMVLNYKIAGVTQTPKTRSLSDFNQVIRDKNGNYLGRYKQHDYTLTMNANTTAELISAIESDSDSYMIDGYDISTDIYVRKLRLSPSGDEITSEILYEKVGDEDRKVEASDLTSAVIEEGDTIEVEFVNNYVRKETSITVNKVDKDMNLIKGGSVFKISSDDGTVILADLNSLTTDYQNLGATADENADGVLNFNGLKYSTNTQSPEHIYTLEEIKAPTGYYRFETPIQFCVTESEGIYIIDEDTVSEYVKLNSEKTVISVINMPTITLPKAGGRGVYLYYILGGCLLLSTMLIIKKRKI